MYIRMYKIECPAIRKSLSSHGWICIVHVPVLWSLIRILSWRLTFDNCLPAEDIFQLLFSAEWTKVSHKECRAWGLNSMSSSCRLSAGKGRGAADGTSKHGAGSSSSSSKMGVVKRHGCSAGRDRSMMGYGKWMMNLKINNNARMAFRLHFLQQQQQ